jgi:V/A-type H+-transporting ATPase subunit A
MNPGDRASAPKVLRAAGALVEAAPARGAALFELARVGDRGLLAEVLGVRGEVATLQVYEDTTGLRLGEPVELSGHPLEAELGPGLLGGVLDGVGRPLDRLAERDGDFVRAGAAAPTLDAERRWSFESSAIAGAEVAGGDLLGSVEERPGFRHPILVPPGIAGRIARIEAGCFGPWEPFGALDDGTPLTLAQRWPVRRPRPVAQRLAPDRPLVTGQRVLDFLFPVAEGGSVAVPGGFGTGKTVIEQSLARHARVDIVVYIGCGERGNEMAEVLAELPHLPDPTTGRPLADRTVLIVNTSNMPVSARESSIYLGLTIAEYFRDLGLRVAVMADSLSRWAEALREIGARLREMPGEEGYPTAMASRLARAFERAGRVEALGRPQRTGSVTFVAAVSPPGGDLSEPVTQATLRVAGALWALDASLAQRRQFPAVSWETSYSLYAAVTGEGFESEGGPGWTKLRREILALLDRDAELREIASLVGSDALQDRDRLLLDVAHTARETLLGQSAYDPRDANSPPAKTWRLARLVVDLLRGGEAALAGGVGFDRLDLSGVRRALVAVRDAGPDELAAAADAADLAVTRLAIAPLEEPA